MPLPKLRWCLLGAPLLLASCAGSEALRYGVRSLEIVGTGAVSPAAVESCLITRGREPVRISLGLGQPVCNHPPFGKRPPTLELWTWPWTEWPTFNRSVLDHDLKRIVRFYAARGYHAARIAAVAILPEALGSRRGSDACQAELSACKASIRITVAPGEPTRVREAVIAGDDALAPALRQQLRLALSLQPGDPVDEVRHDRTKEKLRGILREHGYAGARVQAEIQVDTARLTADATYRLETGPLYAFGSFQLKGHGALPERPIVAAAGLKAGTVFSPQELREVQREVFAVEAFSAVEIREKLDTETKRANVQVSVTPKARTSVRLGSGILSGATRRNDTGEIQSIPQWDVHLFSLFERRHLLGGLARVSVEERPRLIFSPEFPKTDRIRFGNQLTVNYESPGRFEARTTGLLQAAWQYGPDPFQGFPRSDIFLRVGLRRGFFARQLVATVALQQDLYRVEAGASTFDGEAAPGSYRYSYWEQDLQLDLRDNRIRPNRGSYFALNSKQAARSALSDWAALSLASEARGYAPLPMDLVVAGRLALAANFIGNAAAGLDPASRVLGPNAYRLRGGGANSNRGFVAGRLGAGPAGGVRRWELSVELRVPVGKRLSVVGFADAGDVSAVPRFRFDRYGAALGWGLRYYTPVGAIRLDAGYRLPSLQGAGAGFEQNAPTLPLSGAVGAWHLTLGDSF